MLRLYRILIWSDSKEFTIYQKNWSGYTKTFNNRTFAWLYLQTYDHQSMDKLDGIIIILCKNTIILFIYRNSGLNLGFSINCRNKLHMRFLRADKAFPPLPLSNISASRSINSHIFLVRLESNSLTVYLTESNISNLFSTGAGS